MNEARRREILGTIESWLEELSDDAPLPQAHDSTTGDPPLDGVAHSSVVQAMKGVQAELRQQGKVFNRLRARLDALLDDPKEGDGHSEAILALLDQSDRLERCLARGREFLARSTWWSRRFGGIRSTESLVEAIELIHENLRDRLGTLGIVEIPSEGETFDPTCMKAVGVDAASLSAPEGTVTQTRRRGFKMGDRILRSAEVRVARSCDPSNEAHP